MGWLFQQLIIIYNYIINYLIWCWISTCTNSSYRHGETSFIVSTFSKVMTFTDVSMFIHDRFFSSRVGWLNFRANEFEEIQRADNEVLKYGTGKKYVGQEFIQKQVSLSSLKFFGISKSNLINLDFNITVVKVVKLCLAFPLW